MKNAGVQQIFAFDAVILVFTYSSLMYHYGDVSKGEGEVEIKAELEVEV